MERRKSRQSTYAPTTVDIDYAGDTAKFEHIFKHRDYYQGCPNPGILNFGMKLRGYKCTTNYQAAEPWHYPAKKTFHPSTIYDHEKDKVNNTLKDFSENRFSDVSPIRNQNLPLTILNKNFGVYQNTFWGQELRSAKKISKIGKPPLPETVGSSERDIVV